RGELADPKIKEHRGRVVNTTGDGLLIEFGSVVDAVRCAVEVQREMADRNVDAPPVAASNSGWGWKRLAAIPPKAKKAAQPCQTTDLGSRWSRVPPPRLRREAKTSTFSGVGPAVRIPSPPAASQVRTCLWREFAFLRRQGAVFRRCAGRDERRARQRR